MTLTVAVLRGLTILVSFLSVSATVAVARVSVAQVSGDQTLPTGENTIVTPSGDTFAITGGAGRGNNLFHSFDQFSLFTGEEAVFSHGANINTILGRVTGGSVSNIDGTISVDTANSTADIFLINPQGIVFGPNAALNVGGSFIASTAEKVTFADGNEFSAIAASPVSLTVSQPIGLVMGETAGKIVNGSIVDDLGLQVSPSKTLALVGNGIELTGGGIVAFSGQVALASLAPGNSVALSPQAGPTESSWSLAYQQSESDGLRDIQLSAGAFLEASSTLSDDPSGSIYLVGRNISLSDSGILTDNFGMSQGGNLFVLVSERLSLSNQALMSASTFGPGNAGNLTVAVPQGTIELLDESRMLSQSESTASGAAGLLLINAENLSVLDGSIISTSSLGNGQGGQLQINTPNGVTTVSGDSLNFNSTVSSVTQGPQNAGEIQINTRALLVQAGGQIQSGTFSTGNGGKTQINATESVSVIGVTENIRSQIVSASDNNTGNAGSIEISTGRLSVLDGARVITSTNGAGQGGALTIRAEDVLLEGEGIGPGGLLARTEGSGDSGRLTLIADTLAIQDGARLSVSTDDDASPNNLGTVLNATITARNITLNNGQITAESLSGNGGSLTLNVQAALLLRNNALISATAGTAEAGGRGGNVNINTPNGFVIAIPNENSDIIANAFSGTGGNINITTQNIIGLDARRATAGNTTNDIDASSQFGSDGTIVLNNLDLDPAQGLIELPSNTEEPTQVAQRCAVDSGQQGAFVMTGQGGTPPSPRDIVRNAATGLIDLGGQNHGNVAMERAMEPVMEPAMEPAMEQVMEQAITPASGDRSILRATATPLAATPLAATPLAETPFVEAEAWQKDVQGNIVLVGRLADLQPENNPPVPTCRHQHR